MKKIILILISILIAVFIIFSFLGRRSEYAAEKMLYRALQAYNRVVANPDVAPPQMLTSAQGGIKKVTAKFPESNAAKTAYLKLAQAYLIDEKYDEAIVTSNEILEKYKKDDGASSVAQFSKAVAYEKSDRWEKALKELEVLKLRYVNTPLGLRVPLYIVSHYKKAGEEEKAQKAIAQAIESYTNLKNNNKGTLMGYASATILTQLYMAEKRPEDAAKVVKETIVDYPNAPTIFQQLSLADVLLVKTLNRPKEAIEIYKAFIPKTNNEKIREALQKRIETLKSQQ